MGFSKEFFRKGVLRHGLRKALLCHFGEYDPFCVCPKWCIKISHRHGPIAGEGQGRDRQGHKVLEFVVKLSQVVVTFHDIL